MISLEIDDQSFRMETLLTTQLQLDGNGFKSLPLEASVV